MDRIIKFKGEINSKTEEELIELLRKYVRYFTDSFYSFYKIKDKEELQTKINNGELKPEFFSLTCFLCTPDEETYRGVKGFIREEDFKNYLKFTQYYLELKISKQINKFIDIKELK